MSSSTASLVEKATSELLIGPDWGMNLEICDAINYDPGQARETVKAIKKRLASKNGTIQLLALTVLETIMKNCGEVVHQNVAEKEVLNEMVKIVKKRSDMEVRDKILVLLDSWQEAFGGLSSKYPQYYMAYNELRGMGVEFPNRAPDAVPMFTPPVTQPPPPPAMHSNYPSYPQSSPPFRSPLSANYGQTPYSPPTRLDQVMSIPTSPTWGPKDIDAAQSGVEVLNEMLNALDIHDKQALSKYKDCDMLLRCCYPIHYPL